MLDLIYLRWPQKAHLEFLSNSQRLGLCINVSVTHPDSNRYIPYCIVMKKCRHPYNKKAKQNWFCQIIKHANISLNSTGYEKANTKLLINHAAYQNR